MKTIIFNGPPSCGKSEAVLHTLNKLCYFSDHDVTRIRMADPLYNALRELFSLEVGEWEDMYNGAKEEPSERLWGMSPRQAMIWLAEEVMKPKFGKTFFGEVAGMKAESFFSEHNNGVVLCEDGGFADEVNAYDLQLLALPHELHIVRIYREGCTFENDSPLKNDSRSYLIPETVDAIWWEIDNSFDDVIDYRKEVDRIVSSIMEN